jgi:hypothetical protein
MADVLKKIIEANDFKNGTAVVSIDKFGNLDNHTVDTTNNQVLNFSVQSGILDTRFDDVRYYTGDTAS